MSDKHPVDAFLKIGVENAKLIRQLAAAQKDIDAVMWDVGIERERGLYTWPFHGVRYATLSDAMRSRLHGWSGLRIKHPLNVAKDA